MKNIPNTQIIMTNNLILKQALTYVKKQSEFITLEATRFNDDFTKIETYAIRLGSSCWNKKRQGFVYEPMPSNREDVFFLYCRFDNIDDAILEWETNIQPKLDDQMGFVI